MKKSVSTLIVLSALLVSGCTSKYYSGFTFGQLGGGHIVTYQEVRSLQSGSISTVWYRGSDETFHYFDHFVKTTTKYRVKKEEILIENEFPRKSKKSINLMDLELKGQIKEKA